MRLSKSQVNKIPRRSRVNHSLSFPYAVFKHNQQSKGDHGFTHWFCKALCVAIGAGVENVAWLAAVEAEVLLESPHSLPWKEMGGAELHGLLVETRGPWEK